MKKARVLLIEDTIDDRDHIQKLIDENPELNLELAWHCTNVLDASIILGEEKDEVSLMIVDSEIDGNRRQGTDFVLMLSRLGYKIPTIIASGHPDLGDSASEADARYMTKPVRKERFVKEVKRLLNINENPSFEYFLSLNGDNGFSKVYRNDILFIESNNMANADGVILFEFKNGKVNEHLINLSKKNVSPFHKLSYYTDLENSIFCRINNKQVINTNYISMVTPDATNIFLKNVNKNFSVSEVYKDNFKQKYQTR